ncbi:MAG: DUF3109 domain-containing protein [Clostridia bacterium]
MSRLDHYRYYGTPDPMPRQEAYLCERYMKQHKAQLYLFDRYLLDLPALLRPFHLDCFNCHRVHRETCCENGQPYAVEQWQQPLLDEVTEQIAQTYLPDSVKQLVCQHGIWENVRRPGTIRLHHGTCLFAQSINGQLCCSIHAHAEGTGRDVYDVKPFSCQLYPLELIQVGSHVLITALTEETASFSRWGFDYLDEFYCANQERRRLATHLDESLFSLEGYRPAYQWGETLLRRAFGDSIADAISKLVETHDHEAKDRIPG